MTNWKDQLPEYEPGKDSWNNLERSLDFEKQLARSLAGLPRHQPREESWNRIERRLTHKRRPLIRYLTAAAAAAILLLAGIFLLQEKDRQTGKFGTPIVQQPFPPADNVPAKPEMDTAGEPASGSIPETGRKFVTGNTSAPAGGSTPEHRRKLARVARNSPEPANGTARENATNLSAERPSEAVETAGLLAGSGSLLEISALPNVSESLSKSQESPRPLASSSSLTPDAGSKEQEPAKGHHRVIRIQWKKPKTQVSLAGLPGNSRLSQEFSAEQKQNDGTTFIKIKL